jgi:hypothetical protein
MNAKVRVRCFLCLFTMLFFTWHDVGSGRFSWEQTPLYDLSFLLIIGIRQLTLRGNLDNALDGLRASIVPLCSRCHFLTAFFYQNAVSHFKLFKFYVRYTVEVNILTKYKLVTQVWIIRFQILLIFRYRKGKYSNACREYVGKRHVILTPIPDGGGWSRERTPVWTRWPRERSHHCWGSYRKRPAYSR